MKIKIVKKKIIKEAAKRAKDLPKGCTVNIDLDIGDSAVYISYSDPNNTIEGALEAFGEYKINKTLIFEVSDIKATKGYGPLLYDILLEIVYKHFKGGVAASSELVSDEAKNVWNYYLSNRPDVETFQMDLDKKTINRYKPVKLKHLTPNNTNDDRTQYSSVEHAAGMGNWKKFAPKKRVANAKKNPELAMKWHEQSISKYFVKKDDKNLRELNRFGILTFNNTSDMDS